MKLAITAAVYQIDENLGGGWRGIVLDRRTNERHASEVYTVPEEAREWAETKANNLMSSSPWSPGLSPRPYWVRNVWT